VCVCNFLELGVWVQVIASNLHPEELRDHTSCGVWVGFKRLIELEVEHQVSWLHKLTHVSGQWSFFESMEDLRCKNLCKNHMKLKFFSLRLLQSKGLSAECPIPPFLSPTKLSSLDVHVRTYAKVRGIPWASPYPKQYTRLLCGSIGSWLVIILYPRIYKARLVIGWLANLNRGNSHFPNNFQS